jgi:toxin ParE1/3/4
VDASVRLLLEAPAAGRLGKLPSPRARELRSWGVKGFQAYLIFYRSERGNIVVVRLLHGARDLSRLFEDE